MFKTLRWLWHEKLLVYKKRRILLKTPASAIHHRKYRHSRGIKPKGKNRKPKNRKPKTENRNRFFLSGRTTKILVLVHPPLLDLGFFDHMFLWWIKCFCLVIKGVLPLPPLSGPTTRKHLFFVCLSLSALTPTCWSTFCKLCI